jgi:chemotaxis protein CheD
MLPSRSKEQRDLRNAVLDGCYADEAIALMIKEINAVGAPHREYQVKLIGGGNMFPDSSNPISNVAVSNIGIARLLVKKHGFNCVAEHLGGDGHRIVIFDVWSGEVWVKHSVIVHPDGMYRITDSLY